MNNTTKEKAVVNEEYMTLDELCTLLHICRNTGRRLINQPDFPCIRIGKRFRIHKEGFAEWQEKYKGKTVPLDEPSAMVKDEP